MLENLKLNPAYTRKLHVGAAAKAVKDVSAVEVIESANGGRLTRGNSSSLSSRDNAPQVPANSSASSLPSTSTAASSTIEITPEDPVPALPLQFQDHTSASYGFLTVYDYVQTVEHLHAKYNMQLKPVSTIFVISFALLFSQCDIKS